jgi:DNA-binding MarR family transcriptional regulator
MFEDLNPLLNSPLSLSIMTLLMRMEEADFDFLKEKTAATDSNLTIQLSKLAEAGYITEKKTFTDRDSRMSCKITMKGTLAFDEYVNAIQNYSKKN